MMNFWPAILFGWPAIITAIALSIAGVIRKKPAWFVVAVVLVIPFSFYLTGSPRFGWMGLTIPLLLVGAAISVRFGKPGMAWFFLALLSLLCSWLAFIVLSQ